MIFACLTGTNAHEILKEIELEIDKHILHHIKKHVSKKTYIQIQRKIIFKLISKFSEKSLVSITKIIPILSGVIGGSNDFLHTHLVAQIAKEIFIEKKKLIK